MLSPSGINNPSLIYSMVHDGDANGMHLMEWSHNCPVAHENMYTSEACKTLLFLIGNI